MSPSHPCPAPLFRLDAVRAERRLSLCQRGVAQRRSQQRALFDALYASGELFSASGARRGRALLTAADLIERAARRLEELSGEGLLPAPRLPATIAEEYALVDRLLKRADTLLAREPGSLSRLPALP